jgi:hypothetical protein
VEGVIAAALLTIRIPPSRHHPGLLTAVLRVIATSRWLPIGR